MSAVGAEGAARVTPAVAAVPVAVTGWSVHLPDVSELAGDGSAGARDRGPGDPPGPGEQDPRLASLPAAAAATVAALLSAPAVPPARAGQLLGPKGLLYKEPATRLALCAVHRALGLAPKQRPTGPVDPRTAVIACGNLGNLETVVEVARAVRAGGVREVSPLAAPNASSNVVASTVARWFGFGGPNLMVCSGATAGLDGLTMAVRLLRAGRADRVVLVGAEPDDEVAAAVHAGDGRPKAPLRAGAACLLLQRATAGQSGPVWMEPVTGHAPPVAAADLWVGPPGVPETEGFDPTTGWGDTYGAQGVLAAAVAAALVAGGHAAVAGVRCGDPAEGWRLALLRAGPEVAA